MSKLPFRRFLRTGDAIQIHVVCLLLIVVLSWSLWTGNAQPDYKFGLLFAVIVYPVLLVLSWWSKRLDPIVTNTARPVDVSEGLRRRGQKSRSKR